MSMNKEQAKQEAKNRLFEYLDMITTNKGNQYVCPICRSGTGRNKTPAGMLSKDKLYYHCFSCGFHGDIFNLIGVKSEIADPAEQNEYSPAASVGVSGANATFLSRPDVFACTVCLDFSRSSL